MQKQALVNSIYNLCRPIVSLGLIAPDDKDGTQPSSLYGPGRRACTLAGLRFYGLDRTVVLIEFSACLPHATRAHQPQALSKGGTLWTSLDGILSS